MHLADYDDPYGFRRMSIGELRDWIDGLYSPPDSLEYYQAQTVLANKLDRRDHQVRVAQIVVGGLLSVAGLAIALAQAIG